MSTPERGGNFIGINTLSASGKRSNIMMQLKRYDEQVKQELVLKEQRSSINQDNIEVILASKGH